MTERARLTFRALLIVALSLLPVAARAGADIRVQFGALQRILSEQMFTTEGRRYIKGTKDAACSFAYLEHPQLDATGDGQLKIRARFSGRSALDVFGHCLGFGDDFDLTIVATPYFEAGAIRLKDVHAEPAKKGVYASRVCRSLAASVPAQFAYPAADEARRALEAPSGPSGYTRRLKRFEVTRLQVTAEGLLLTLDFELIIGA